MVVAVITSLVCVHGAAVAPLPRLSTRIYVSRWVDECCLQSVHAIPTSQHRFRRERPTETVYRIVIANLKRSLATPYNQLHAMLDNFKAVFNLALKDEIKLTLTKGLSDKIRQRRKLVEIILCANNLVVYGSNRFQMQQALARFHKAFTALGLTVNLTKTGGSRLKSKTGQQQTGSVLGFILLRKQQKFHERCRKAALTA
ncbi:uncharacterized protein LOC111272344 [Varroa jacobsoni]|uniref:uncharacterized protein LOC111272344 n=1 Tax=Varroa jacobsoni TaxID=62625 RepID=UPI000BFA83D1|nr:uncharacterized protein LOC111272344 [Varroa jacobsoni]